MVAPLLLWRGPRVWLISASGAVTEVPVPGGREALVRAAADGGPVPGSRTAAPRGPLAVVPGALRPNEGAGGTDLVRAATPTEGRVALERLPPLPLEEERSFAFDVARRALARALAQPDERVATLAREEERIERALVREGNAQRELAEGAEETVAEYLRGAARFLDEVERHHAEVEGRLARTVRAHAPNLSAVLGEKVAARLIALAGSLRALAQMPASRLQLLGARRRPSHGRGPRFGAIYRAARMDEVPLERQGAYARTVASLAVIAARLDLAGRPGESARELLARRDRRIRDLRAGGGRR